MTAALVALGSNLGGRHENLDQAIKLLAATPEIRVISVSPFHPTRPIGGPVGQGDFLNAAVLLETSLSAPELLAALQEIETSLGRQRHERWAERSIDLDLLLFGEAVIDTPELRVPHPRMEFRRFVLEPASEVAPGMRHPKIGRTVAELRDYLRSEPNYVAIAGAPFDSKTRVGMGAAQAVDGQFLADPFREQFEGWIFQDCRVTFEPETAPRDPDPIELEVLRSRAGLVVQAVASGSSAPVISDFWCEECRPAEVPKNLTIISPKLLVWLEGPLESLDPVFFRLPPASRALMEKERERACATIKSLFIDAPIPLKLRLDPSDLSAAIDDLSATIQSMRG
jgi:2-amino-4-hydroxy-6-hydroxymethyldihydropteridine diphosphokinase